MIGEVISIGDELTSGQRLDTNSQWISQRLGELGVRVLYHSTAADELPPCSEVFRQAVNRADVVVASGGLGPTADDLTREVIAETTGTRLALDDEALETIRERFARLGRDMPPSNQVQAMFPEGSRPIPNPHGTAPGIAMEIRRERGRPCHLFALPGVPAELHEMWEASVSPAVVALAGAARVIRHRRIKCFGAGESRIEQMLPDLVRRGRTPTVGITVHEATITLRVTAEAATAAECDALIEPTVATIYERLGRMVFGEEDDELEQAVARLLIERTTTLATAEWGTAGLLSRWLSRADAAADHYVGGAVVRSGRALAAALGVSSDVIDAHSPSSAKIAEAMASSAQRRMGTDFALAVGEISGGGEGDDGRFHVALATSGHVESRSFSTAGHPSILRARSAKQALNLLRLALLDSSPLPSRAELE